MTNKYHKNITLKMTTGYQLKPLLKVTSQSVHEALWTLCEHFLNSKHPSEIRVWAPKFWLCTEMFMSIYWCFWLAGFTFRVMLTSSNGPRFNRPLNVVERHLHLALMLRSLTFWLTTWNILISVWVTHGWLWSHTNPKYINQPVKQQDAHYW